MLTVQDVLDFPIMKASKQKSGKDSLANKLVEWVSVIEYPVENFVRENEFVLSTGIGCHEDPDILLGFVRDVYNSGATALAFATGRYIFEIPEEVLQYAEEMDFIIIEIPWEIRFSDIVHEVMSQISQIQHLELRRAKDIQQRLIQLVLEGKPLVHITNYIEKELQQTVLIFNKKGEVMAGSANQDLVITLWNRLKKDQAPHESNLSLHSQMNKIIHRNHQLLHLIIQSNGNHEGDFFIVTDAAAVVSQQDSYIIEQAIITSALWFSRNNKVTKTEMRLENDFLVRLAKGEEMSPDHIQIRSELFKMNLDLHYECIVGYPENLDSLKKQVIRNAQNKQAWLERMIMYIKDEMLYAAESVQRQVLVGYDEDLLIIFIETANETTTDTVNHFLDFVERRFSHVLPGVTFSWGIGKQREGTGQFHNSFQKAKAALDMGRMQKGIGKRINYNETRINRLLLNLAINNEVQDITMSTISSLIEYDEKRDMDLINTFIAYNKNSGNVSQTARELNLHRQSLLYRLRKIESLTGLSMIDPDDLFLLDFSIKVWSTGVICRKKAIAEL